MEDIVAYYKKLGAPGDQTALISLLREIQELHGGIPAYLVESLAEQLQVKQSYLLAIIKRIPSLRLQDTHCLELCAGPNCGKAASLAAFAESLKSDTLQVKYVPCQRMCGKGPNIRYDGRRYHMANEELLKFLIMPT